MNQRQITEKFNAKLPKIEIINLESKQSGEFSTHKNQQHNQIQMNGSRNASVICLRQQVDNPENLQLVVGLYCYAVVAYNDCFAELVSFVTRDKKQRRNQSP